MSCLVALFWAEINRLLLLHKWCKMGGDDDAAAAVEEKLHHCASCGRAEIDDIKLKDCNSCDLVRYCSDDCQQDHKSEHEEEDCKKRAAELRDELLFKQPESTHLGDCPICMIPLPIDEKKCVVRPCCFNYICEGCMHQSLKRALDERSGFPLCPFCRQPAPPSRDVNRMALKQTMKRVKANDPRAMCKMGETHHKEEEYIAAFEWYTKAAGLGHAEAHYLLAQLYGQGNGVEKDFRKENHHLEEAAIGGHPSARHNLALREFEYGNAERAIKHWIIAANQGHDKSIKCLMELFKQKCVSKENLDTALRGYQAAIEATKSPQRKEADEFHGRN